MRVKSRLASSGDREGVLLAEFFDRGDPKQFKAIRGDIQEVKKTNSKVFPKQKDPIVPTAPKLAPPPFPDLHLFGPL
jgi:hypothetical protein